LPSKACAVLVEGNTWHDDTRGICSGGEHRQGAGAGRSGNLGVLNRQNPLIPKVMSHSGEVAMIVDHGDRPRDFMKLAVALVPIISLLVCCASGGQAAAQPAVSQQQIVDRFTADIWPAMVGYGTAPDQGSPASVALDNVIDPGLDPGARTSLLDAVLDLNIVQVADTTHDQISTENVQLGSASVNTETVTGASLDVCYTYTALAYGTSSQPQRSPGASHMTVTLNKTDTWFLHSITNDHVTPSCETYRV
jgi:hypothetical protein